MITALHKCVCFEPECSVPSEGELSVWEIYSASQFMLLFGNSDQAELEKESSSQEKVRTTAVHLWEEILEPVVMPFCCLFQKYWSLYGIKASRQTGVQICLLLEQKIIYFCNKNLSQKCAWIYCNDLKLLTVILQITKRTVHDDQLNSTNNRVLLALW